MILAFRVLNLLWTENKRDGTCLVLDITLLVIVPL